MTHAAPPEFRAVYDEHFRFVWRSLRRLGVREADVDDALQDAFVIVHRKLPEFEGRSKITTWLFSICMGVASDRRRSAYARRVQPGGEALEHEPDASPDAQARAEKRERLELLERALDQLPDEQRIVFSLFELEGLKSDEIAELCGIPVGTVHSRLRLAREAFRKHSQRLVARQEFTGTAPALTLIAFLFMLTTRMHEVIS